VSCIEMATCVACGCSFERQVITKRRITCSDECLKRREMELQTARRKLKREREQRLASAVSRRYA
jgi:hypothetical protein